MADEIPHFDVVVTSENYQKDILPILEKIRPAWKEQELFFKESPKEVSRGLLNTMVRCYSSQDPDDVIMIRVINTVLNQFIDRSVEVPCIKYLHKHDCAPQILATFKTGFCYQFIHGEVLNCRRLSEDPIWRCLAEELAKIHAANVDEIPGFLKEVKFKSNVDKVVNGFPESMTDPAKNERLKKNLPDKATIKREVEETWDHALSFGSDLVLTHNDTRAENVIWNPETGVAKFIDYEVMGYNYRSAELAAHFQRYGGFEPTDYSLIPDKKFQLKWIRVYLEKYYQETGRKASDVTDNDVRRLYVQTRKFQLVFLMLMVASGPMFDEMNVIPDKSLDMLGLSIDALQEYYKQKDFIVALKLPED